MPVKDPLHVVCPHCAATNRVPSTRLDAGARCGRCKGALFTGAPLQLGATDFDKHIEASDVPLLVDFWAPWCGPCKMMAPVLIEAAAALEPQVRVAKLNTDDAPMIAGRYGIRGIPTLILFVDGREVGRQAGVVSLAQLLRWVGEFQGRSAAWMTLAGGATPSSSAALAGFRPV